MHKYAYSYQLYIYKAMRNTGPAQLSRPAALAALVRGRSITRNSAHGLAAQPMCARAGWEGHGRQIKQKISNAARYAARERANEKILLAQQGGCLFAVAFPSRHAMLPCFTLPAQAIYRPLLGLNA